MKARSKELLDRAVAATVAAIEIYNKPDFLYREEAFAVLAINGWELLLKAKWLADHNPPDVMEFAMNLPTPVFRGTADIYFTNLGDLRAAPDGRMLPAAAGDHCRQSA